MAPQTSHKHTALRVATTTTLAPSRPTQPPSSSTSSSTGTAVTVQAMSELQKRWAKAKLDAMAGPAGAAGDGGNGIGRLEEEDESSINPADYMTRASFDDDSASSASSASSTGTIVPSASHNLFARPHGMPRGGGRTLDPIPWTTFFERELFLDSGDIDEKDDDGDAPGAQESKAHQKVTHHAYLTSPVDKGPLFVMHHGAGSSGLSFAVVGAEIRKRLPSAGILSLDARDHGLTKVDDAEGAEAAVDLSLRTLSSDLLRVIRLAQKAMHWSELPPLVLVGHSLGGAVVTDLAYSGRLNTTPTSSPLLGFAVLDVVEGSAIDALQSMQTYLGTRPPGFPTLQSGIEWHIRTRTIRNATSARTSVPALLVDHTVEDNKPEQDTSIIPEAESTTSPASTSASASANPRPWRWRTDLGATQPFWEGWFVGLSKKFLGSRGGKLLLLAGTDRLDTELTIGQMQGKYALQVFPEAGHFIHEDLPEKTAMTLVDFYQRNNRSAMVLPPKVSELLAQGKKV
ncbi:protein phosphatase methylesterase 1 [Ophiostoma piceae UAMH 11346]|uniref:Protein phosphatase methylesterase 1 n=1 Tax=Ophiostoma piceae (strain UAMH 11346) TaxID=1262450 RepID=S3BZ76_OPHP1|nr:protein phosphatase methylesterase 1 [Ophiostoma piceae UAMH 11346]